MQVLELGEKVWRVVFRPKSNKNINNFEKEIQRDHLGNNYRDYAKNHEEVSSMDPLKTKLDARSLGISYLRRY